MCLTAFQGNNAAAIEMRSTPNAFHAKTTANFNNEYMVMLTDELGTRRKSHTSALSLQYCTISGWAHAPNPSVFEWFVKDYISSVHQ